MERVSVGDLVESTAGRDKGEYAVVVASFGNTVKIVSGITDKAKSPKTKNVKHIRISGKGVLTDLAEKINSSPVSDKWIRRLINSIK